MKKNNGTNVSGMAGVNLGNTPGSRAIENKSPIILQMYELYNSFDEVEKSITILAEKLTPILIPGQPEGEALLRSTTTECSPHLLELIGLTNRTRSIVSRIEKLTQSAQI